METRLEGPGWTTTDRVAVRGRAYDGTGSPVDLARAFGSADSLSSVLATAQRLEGYFAAVVETDSTVFLVCDHARTIPLYVRTMEPIAVGDNTASLPVGERKDPVAESEFALTRYVTRGETVHEDVVSARAGEVLEVPRDDPESFERHRYDRYRPTTRVEGDQESLLAAMDDVLGAVFDRVARIAGDRRVAVPLSGGIDSRLVATMLVERGVEVLGFTFGVHGHADVEVSRDVADALGIEWAFVEYDQQKWHEWYHSEERANYHEYAFGGDAVPFLAEWPAVWELRERGILTDELVCPGHTVATPSERAPERWLANPPTEGGFTGEIVDEHYSLWAFEDEAFESAFSDRIRSEAELESDPTGPEALAAYEQWEWSTRMATFTHGDLRVYDWFELEWWLPLWDPRYVRFWSSVPVERRLGKSLQAEYTARKFAEVAGVEFATARRTDRDWTPVDQLRRTFEARPSLAVTGSFEEWLGNQAVPPSQFESWGNYPLGWYGAIPEDEAGRFEPANSLYALRTLEALDLVSFDPARIADPPLWATLELPPSGE